MRDPTAGCGTRLRKLGMQDEPSKPPDGPAELEPGEDYYYDGPYLVFTEQYHLKRGTCCGSGCRHCPYRSTPASE
jgi:hypothetical protein